MFYKLPGWKVVYFNYDGIIFLKDIPFNKPWIDRFAIDLNKWQSKGMDLQRLGTKQIDPIPLTNRAYMLKTIGLYDAAIKEIREALKVSPDNSESYKFLAEIYAKRKDHRKAFENARIATVLRPYNSAIRVQLATAYVNLKDYTQAIKQFDRVLEGDPENIKALFGKARALGYLGKHRIASKYLDQAKAIAPNEKEEISKISDIIEKNKRPETIHKESIKK
jgi:tetratricopeptide (TPR) repeat protein